MDEEKDRLYNLTLLILAFLGNSISIYRESASIPRSIRLGLARVCRKRFRRIIRGSTDSCDTSAPPWHCCVPLRAPTYHAVPKLLQCGIDLSTRKVAGGVVKLESSSAYNR